MGMSTPKGGSGFGGRSVATTLAEINVTPLVDVMLVLLIVFMVSAPMMQQGVHVDLPKANAGSLDEVPDQLVLVVNKSKQILINNNVVDPGMLGPKLLAVANVKPNVQVFIQADQNVPYGYIAQVMAEVKRAKINRVGLVTEPADPNTHLSMSEHAATAEDELHIPPPSAARGGSRLRARAQNFVFLPRPLHPAGDRQEPGLSWPTQTLHPQLARRHGGSARRSQKRPPKPPTHPKLQRDRRSDEKR